MTKLREITLDILVSEMANYFADVEIVDIEKVTI